MSSPEAITRAETWDARWLWFGVLTGPIAWSIQLGSNWFLAEVVVCGGSAVGMTTGVGIIALTATVNAVLLGLTVLSGIVALRCSRLLEAKGDETTGQRALWMARAGIINAITFSLVIAASYVGIFMSTGCPS